MLLNFLYKHTLDCGQKLHLSMALVSKMTLAYPNVGLLTSDFAIRKQQLRFSLNEHVNSVNASMLHSATEHHLYSVRWTFLQFLGSQTEILLCFSAKKDLVLVFKIPFNFHFSMTVWAGEIPSWNYSDFFCIGSQICGHKCADFSDPQSVA